MIKIEIWSDINCPFCYIGKRHLEAALSECPDPQGIEIEWKSFELDREANPPKGSDNTELLAKKYGRDRKWAEEMNRSMTQMALSAGLEFHLEKVIPANSFNAHRLIHLARKYHLQDQMKEKLLSLKFTEGKDINDPAILHAAAKATGLADDVMTSFMNGDEFSAEVRRDEAEALKMRISGVPFFLFNQQVALSGAQPVQAFTEVLNKLSKSI